MAHAQKIIGIKKLHQQLKGIPDRVAAGEEFLVIKNSEPVFIITHWEKKIEKKKKYTIQDILSLQFKTKDRDISKNVDTILYGKK